MKIKTPLTKTKLKTHLTYGWWMYAILIASAVFGWNLIYTTTSYRSPEDLRIDIYIQSGTVSEDRATHYMEKLGKEATPDMETIQTVILSSSPDDYYGNMQLMVYVYANEGDIFLLRSDDFKNLAGQGVFIDLEPYVASGYLQTEGINLDAGYMTVLDDEGNPTRDMRLFGLPLNTLTVLAQDLNMNTDNMYVGIATYSGNENNAIAFLNALIQNGSPD